MSPETYERVIETSAGELAERESITQALKRVDKAQLAAELRKAMESEVKAGNVLMLTEEEIRMVSSFRAFRPTGKPGAVFKWQTRPDETPAQQSSAEQALSEIWGATCPDCGPEDYAAIAAHVAKMQEDLRRAGDMVRGLDSYDFECEAGPLGNAVLWIALKKLLNVARECGPTIPNAGEIAYEAYRKDSGGKSLATGQPIPSWDQLPAAIQKAWGAAAEAVVAVVVGRTIT